MRTSRTSRLAFLTAAAIMGATSVANASGPTQGGALDRLKAGNATFVTNASQPLPVTADQRLALAKGQQPFAIVLSCADSRVPPEVIFHTGLGDLFVVRVAGEALDKSVLASIEYAAEHLQVGALVVMGHASCGAVRAAVETRPGGTSMGPNLDYLIGTITPAFSRMRSGADAEHLRDAILANVEQVVNDLLTRSPIITRLHAAGKLQIAGAYYELESGRVRFSEPLPPAMAASQAASDSGHRK